MHSTRRDAPFSSPVFSKKHAKCYNQHSFCIGVGLSGFIHGTTVILVLISIEGHDSLQFLSSGEIIWVNSWGHMTILTNVSRAMRMVLSFCIGAGLSGLIHGIIFFLRHLRGMIVMFFIGAGLSGIWI